MLLQKLVREKKWRKRSKTLATDLLTISCPTRNFKIVQGNYCLAAILLSLFYLSPFQFLCHTQKKKRKKAHTPEEFTAFCPPFLVRFGWTGYLIHKQHFHDIHGQSWRFSTSPPFCRENTATPPKNIKKKNGKNPTIYPLARNTHIKIKWLLETGVATCLWLPRVPMARTRNKSSNSKCYKKKTKICSLLYNIQLMKKKKLTAKTTDTTFVASKFWAINQEGNWNRNVKQRVICNNKIPKNWKTKIIYKLLIKC